MPTHDTTGRPSRARRLHLVRDGGAHTPYGVTPAPDPRRAPSRIVAWFLASPYGQGLDADDAALVASLLGHARDVGPAGALRWTEAMVHELRFVVLPAQSLYGAPSFARAPLVLRRLVRFGHAAIAVPVAATEAVLRAVDAWEAELMGMVALGEVPGWGYGCDHHDHGWRPVSRWSPDDSARWALPLERRQVARERLTALARQVGGVALLEALPTVPLPDEPLVLDGVAPDVRPAVEEAGRLVAAVCAAVLDVEHRTAAWRLLHDVAVGDSSVLRRSPRSDTAAGAALWLVCTTNGTLGRSPEKLSSGRLHAELRLRSGCASRAATFRRVVAVDQGEWFDTRSLGTTRYLVAAARRRLVARRDELLAEVRA